VSHGASPAGKKVSIKAGPALLVRVHLLIVDIEPIDLPLRVVAKLGALGLDVLGRGVEARLGLARLGLATGAVWKTSINIK
jgi:hypothetical protein